MAAPQGMPFHHMSLEAWGGGIGGLSSWVSGDCDNLKGNSWPAANPGGCTEPEIYASLSDKEASLFTQQHWPGGQAPGLERLFWGSQEVLLALDAITVL